MVITVINWNGKPKDSCRLKAPHHPPDLAADPETQRLNISLIWQTALTKDLISWSTAVSTPGNYDWLW